jgi:zinc protease
MIKKKILIAFLLFVQVALVHAQAKLRDNLFLKKLPNGLDVLVVEDNSVPLATIMITFKTGAFTESSDISGLNGLYQSMMFKANKNYNTSSDFSYYNGSLGVISNATTSAEYSCTFLTLPKSNLDEGLNVFNLALRFPLLKDDEIENEKTATENQLRQRESNPFFQLNEAMSQHLWGDLANRKNAIGTHESIHSFTRRQLEMIRDMYFYPNNALLVVAGDVSHDEVFDKTGSLFKDWKKSDFNPFEKWPVPEFASLTKPDYFIVKSVTVRAPEILINWQGPDTRRDVKATYAADVFSYILNQHSSALSKALIESGLASNVSIGYLTLGHTGPITLTMIPNPSKIKECLAAIKKQLMMMDNDDYLTDEQIETAKLKLGIKQVREQDVTSDFVHTLSFWWATASLDYFINYNENLKKVGRADLKAYVRKYIKDKAYCAGLLISPELNEKINADSFFTATNQ